MTSGGRFPAARASLGIAAASLVARLAVVAWAGHRFPPAHDGVRYDALARRIAAGAGYTWQWPDGRVDSVAHYPVGYPALLGAAYRVFGSGVVVAGCLNACIGALAAVAVHRLVLAVASERSALVAGLAVALHPGLVLYTPGIMTEGATAALVTVAAWLAVSCSRSKSPPRARVAWLGLALGAAALVRPQALLLVPLFGFLAARWKGIGACAVVVALVCTPWVARNCGAVGRCTLSTNAGWNLLIGVQSESGGWQSVQVPPACTDVFGESETDACFGHEATAAIRRAPFGWLAGARKKLDATFDYGGIGGYYLFLSNPDAFPWKAVIGAGAVETLLERATILLALLGVGRAAGPRERLRLGVVALGVLFSVLIPGWVAVVALCVAMGLLGSTWLLEHPLHAVTLCVLATTAAVHAVFFGAARYALLAAPLVTALAVVVAMEWRSPRHTEGRLA